MSNIYHKGLKKELILKGLCCAQCATQIETESKKIYGVKSAVVDFISPRLILEFYNSEDSYRIINEAKSIVKKIESDIEVIDIHKNLSTEDKVNSNYFQLARLILGTIIFSIVSLIHFSEAIELFLYLVSYLSIGGEVLLRAINNIRKGHLFDENFLMGIATVGAFAIGEYPEGVAVMLFYQVGELFQEMAVNRSRKSITALMDIRPDFANLKKDDTIKKVAPEEVMVGELIIVKPGEKVPLDGIIIDGNSMVDTSSLTGESIPREVYIGDEILSGTINQNSLLTVKVEKSFEDSTISKILDLVQNASCNKAPTENFITKFARYYTPIVVFSALVLAIIPPIIIEGATFSQWIYRALAFLVVSCPCALVISVPLGFFGGIGAASKNGILVKGGNYLEALNHVEMVVFDKTGTLTKGIFKVTDIAPQNNFSGNDIIAYAACAEYYSNHPIAISIKRTHDKKINQRPDHYEEILGNGIRAMIDSKEILVGNHKLMMNENIPYCDIETVGTIIHIAIDKTYAGYIIISDEIKEDAHEAVQSLKKMGIRKIIMLTGDHKNVGGNIAKQLDLDDVYTNLLPHEKVDQLEKLYKETSPKGKLVFVGDGINDAPVLARADIGIAMGGIGSDAAIEAADVVIMTDEPSKITTAIKIAKKTRNIVMQNIVFALGVKVLILLFVALGYGTMWEAVFGDVGVALIAVLNSMRALKAE
ncbi:MAG: heavy metal translocating P-type ATPase [Eubacteriales bacterium]